MGWAIKQLWRDLAKHGLYPINGKPPEPHRAQQPETEYRCNLCAEKNTCPAYETGVCFPCPYYEEDCHGTKE